MTSEKDAPAEMPGVEEIARVLFERSVYHGYDAETLKREWTRTEGIHRGNARAILALFAPILAEKEREIERLSKDIAVKARILTTIAKDAEAALAAERERCAKISEDHGALVSNEPIGKACSRNIAAAIRAGGE